MSEPKKECRLHFRYGKCPKCLDLLGGGQGNFTGEISTVIVRKGQTEIPKPEKETEYDEGSGKLAGGNCLFVKQTKPVKQGAESEKCPTCKEGDRANWFCDYCDKEMCNKCLEDYDVCKKCYKEGESNGQ